MDDVKPAAPTEPVARRDPIPLAERRRFTGMHVPAEGEGGLFTQSWFPIALSTEVPAGTIIGRDFLDGRVVIYRGEDGVVRVQSAYCPHIGADLSVGKVLGNRVQCAFHRWEYDENGMCVKTGAGLPPPPGACLYTFPVTERFGIIYVFNGYEPLWQIADFEYPDEQLVAEAFMSELYTCDPWIFASNTPDTQHISVVHGFKFKSDDPMNSIKWEPWGFRMKIDAFHQDNEDLAWEAGIYGSSTFLQQGTVDGWWLGIAAGFSMPKPGTHYVFISVLVRNVDVEGGKTLRERLDFGKFLLARTAAEDKPILDSIHHKVGYLTRADTALARYFDFLRNYPRAHPSRDFIR
ncbi:Rieske (2Fe-2S) protein [Solimonas soli]|uniref:Rieske (2Fe-2S) protein n=1 Tax=Solimonas soli TaxID=413479 RepID=UPI000A041E02|nr:Rieske (2Fe-2S) protein [Solimonas soli]